MSDDLEFHDTAWFARQIDMSADWVKRNRKALPHHRVGRYVKFDAHCVQIYRDRTAIAPHDDMRRTQRSRARS